MARARFRDGSQDRNTHEPQTWRGSGEDLSRREPPEIGVRDARGLVQRSA